MPIFKKGTKVIVADGKGFRKEGTVVSSKSKARTPMVVRSKKGMLFGALAKDTKKRSK